MNKEERDGAKSGFEDVLKNSTSIEDLEMARDAYIKADIAYQLTRLADQGEPQVMNIERGKLMRPTSDTEEMFDTPCNCDALRTGDTRTIVVDGEAINCVEIVEKDNPFWIGLALPKKADKILAAHTCKPAPDASELADAVEKILDGGFSFEKDHRLSTIYDLLQSALDAYKEAHDG